MKRPSIYTIAREAGVSTATVSKIVNNHGNISRETSARVLEIIKKHNYVPQQRKQTESAVGVITFHNNRRPLASPFTGRLLNGSQLFRRKNFTAIMRATRSRGS